jgi:hypothetical protein
LTGRVGLKVPEKLYVLLFSEGSVRSVTSVNVYWMSTASENPTVKEPRHGNTPLVASKHHHHHHHLDEAKLKQSTYA